MTTPRSRFGVLTPSSNTALEPLTSAMVAQVSGVTAHFSRFGVTEIALSQRALGQFDDTHVLAAAKLLADARVDVIGWSGTSAGWLGFDHDVTLCQRIKAETGIQATTSMLALNEIMTDHGVREFGLVTPYTDDVQQRILANYHAEGFTIVAEDHLSISENFAFAEVSAETLTAQVRRVAEQGAPLIVVACTNLNSAQLVAQWEAELGVPILDTTATVVWKMLRMTGHATTPITGWGRLMEGALSHG
ncbi:maleate cis-trans isomerase family protein [Halomonas dongshanensis]|uniref:Aspartate/glutamate racemase family protein n=1 Tax=Halomonas dongshanensis TaxID=2890835 RepID=A0ABT2E992_9GAMM|nr:aspartate/glutamate racemase family protein [Halomonas dongshanensis]MCS2608142.1 aspartate/glutamate racemase family protein [Halomonas dongshanensis]